MNKRLIPGLLFIVAIFSTGCLGDAEEKILGEWGTVTQINPAQHNMHWTFQDNGDVYFYNQNTGEQDTGKYELFMDGTHRVCKIKNTTIQDQVLPMNGEWVIVRLEDDVLIMGTRDYGGFQQRDLFR
jgi:hypothetical protein